jgi:hypothetical protein
MQSARICGTSKTTLLTPQVVGEDNSLHIRIINEQPHGSAPLGEIEAGILLWHAKSRHGF